MMKTLLTALLLIAYTAPALADCYYNGQRYAEGTQVGPYICVAGKWVARN